MTKFIFSFAIVVLLMSECGNNKIDTHSHDDEGTHEHSDGTHKHEDGSEHKDHEEAEHNQEEFKVESDSPAINKDKDHGHSHDDDSNKH
jgi:hypothetical protein